MMETLNADLSELQHFLSLSKSTRNQTLLQSQIQLLQQQIDSLTSSSTKENVVDPTQPQNSNISPPKPVHADLSKNFPLNAKKAVKTYEAISKFGWEESQSNRNRVFVYVTLDSHTEEAEINCQFTKTSFDLIIKDQKRLVQSNLFAAIDPKKSSWKLRKNKRVTITLWKEKSDKMWTSLSGGKGTNLSDDSEKKMKDDPSAGIMEMMKNMYDQGDDDMKRTIAKAWTESREKKSPSMPDMPDKPF